MKDSNTLYLVLFGGGRIYPFAHIPRRDLFPGENVRIFETDKDVSLGSLDRWHIRLNSTHDFREVNFETGEYLQPANTDVR